VRVPLQLIVMDLVGTLLAAVGLAGLVTDLSKVIPAFANRDFAGMVAGVGFALMTFSILRILRILRTRRMQPPGDAR